MKYYYTMRKSCRKVKCREMHDIYLQISQRNIGAKDSTLENNKDNRYQAVSQRFRNWYQVPLFLGQD